MAQKFAEAQAQEAEAAAGPRPDTPAPGAGPPAAPPVQPRRPRGSEWDDDDLGNESYLY